MITREMTIDEVLSAHPEKAQKLVQELGRAGLHCAGCHASTWETLEAGCFGHGMGDEEVDQLVTNLNKILSETLDLNTITITESARSKYLGILAAEGKEGWGIRITEKPGGCNGYEYVLDYSEKAGEDDTVFSSESIDIHVKSALVPRLLGSEIDYIDGLMGAGFKISNPNVRSSCACGTSHGY